MTYAVFKLNLFDSRFARLTITIKGNVKLLHCLEHTLQLATLFHDGSASLYAYRPVEKYESAITLGKIHSLYITYEFKSAN